MAPKPRIPPQEWEKHKKIIIDLYLREKTKLQDVIEELANNHGFHASKAQYILQLSKWKVEKNSKREIWDLASALIRKRKLEGKETEICINGKRVPEKKLKKALSRPCTSQSELAPFSSGFTSGDRKVTASTPKTEDIRTIEVSGMPWFNFQALLESSIISLGNYSQWGWSIGETQLSSSTSIAPEQDWASTGFSFDSPYMCAFVSEHHQDQVQTSSCVDDLVSGNSATIEQASREARRVLARCLDGDMEPDSDNFRTQVASILEETTIEQQEGELVRHVEHLFGKTSSSAAYQLLRYTAYLSSNNLLGFRKTIELASWIVKSENVCAIQCLLNSQEPTVEIFGGNLLVSAARSGDITFVKVLLSKGVDPNFLGGGQNYDRETALHHAAFRGDAALVNVLLEAGASPNICSATGETAFGIALDRLWINKSEIPLMMIASEARVIRAMSSQSRKSYLALAAEDGSLDLVQCMLSAGATANDNIGLEYSALQLAVQRGEVSITEALIAAGADVNYPCGKAYKQDRVKLVTKDSDPFCGPLRTPLQIAILKDDMEILQILIEAGADVNGCPATEYLPWLPCRKNHEHGSSDEESDEESDEDSGYIHHEPVEASEAFLHEVEDFSNLTHTPLQGVVHQGNAAIVRLLVRLGANINTYGGSGTALQVAAAASEGCQMLRLLLSKGADINSSALGPGAMTALQAAARAGNQESVELLIQAGADINAPPCPNGGRTALQAAVESKDINLVRFLIQSGADAHAAAASKNGRTCLQAAAEAGSLELVNIFLRTGFGVNARLSSEGYMGSALQAAVRTGNDAVIARLIDAGADLAGHQRAKNLALSIITAIERGHTSLAQQLISKASASGPSLDLESILYSATTYENFALMRSLIAAGANVNKPRTGYAPIVAAVCFKATEAVNILLKAGAYVTGFEGAEAVRRAVSYDNLATLRMLLEARASPKKIPGSKSPLQLSVERWSIREEVVELLLLHGADANEESGIPLQAAAAKGCVRVVDILLKAGADVNAPALLPRQKTALQGAALTLRTDLVETLIDAGADVNAQPSPEWGVTALQAAVDSGSRSMVRLLLSKGADVNGPPSDTCGATALQKAAIKGNLVITMLLLKHGANVNAAAARSGGRTALEAAAEHGRLDIMFLLLRYDKEPDTFNIRCKRATKLAEKSGHLVLARVLEEWRISHCTAGAGTD